MADLLRLPVQLIRAQRYFFSLGSHSPLFGEQDITPRLKQTSRKTRKWCLHHFFCACVGNLISLFVICSFMTNSQEMLHTSMKRRSISSEKVFFGIFLPSNYPVVHNQIQPQQVNLLHETRTTHTT